MNPQHQATAAASGTAGMLAIVLMGLGRLAGIEVAPEMATAVAMLLAPFVGMVYSRLGISPQLEVVADQAGVGSTSSTTTTTTGTSPAGTPTTTIVEHKA